MAGTPEMSRGRNEAYLSSPRVTLIIVIRHG